MVSGLYLDQDWGEMLVDEEPTVWNISFFWFKRELIRIAYRWLYLESRSISIRHVPVFTGPSVELGRNAAPNFKDDSSPFEYSKLVFTEFVVTLLVDE
jgi:hypothetical protein